MSAATSRRNLLQGAFLGAACACAGARFAFAADAPKSPTGKYICPPCGCSQDGKDFDAPGVCPDAGCGMMLIPKPAPAPKANGAQP
jgi:hypothetical protein